MEKIMKKPTNSKKTKLTRAQIRRGITVSRAMEMEDIPYRKLKLDVLKKVGHTGAPITVSEYGKPIAMIVRIAQS
jgi:hypothetical protein